MGDRIRLSITRWGAAARGSIAAGGAGRVAAVFARSFYLESAGGMACIGDRSLGLGPLNAVCDAPLGTNWGASGLRADEAYRTAGDRILIGNRFVFSTAAVDNWAPPPTPGEWRPEPLRRHLDVLDRHIAGRFPSEGLGPLVFGRGGGDIARAVRASVSGLRTWLTAGAPGNPAPWVEPLIGLGPGLTPSGDDFLGGIMMALYALDRRQALAELAAAVQAGTAATNPISRAHLAAATMGQGSAAVHDLLDDLLRAAPSDLDRRLDAIDHIGHCSGWDVLAGVVTALRALVMRAEAAA